MVVPLGISSTLSQSRLSNRALELIFSGLVQGHRAELSCGVAVTLPGLKLCVCKARGLDASLNRVSKWKFRSKRKFPFVSGHFLAASAFRM
ncbi:MAG: hypothetical protein WA005_09645 [Candidatus Binataceae bacterium]